MIAVVVAIGTPFVITVTLAVRLATLLDERHPALAVRSRLAESFTAVTKAVREVGADALLYANRAAEGLWAPLYFGMDVRPLLAKSGLAVPHSERRLTIEGESYEVRAIPFRFAGESESSTILTFRKGVRLQRCLSRRRELSRGKRRQFRTSNGVMRSV